MFVNAGAPNLLLDAERQKFLDEDWPRIRETMQRLGLKPEDLLNGSERAKPRAEEEDGESHAGD